MEPSNKPTLNPTSFPSLAPISNEPTTTPTLLADVSISTTKIPKQAQTTAQKPSVHLVSTQTSQEQDALESTTTLATIASVKVATTKSLQTSEGSNDVNDEFGSGSSDGNANDWKDSTVIIVAISVVISVCCVVLFCAFGVTMLFCMKKEDVKREEIAFQNQLFRSHYARNDKTLPLEAKKIDLKGKVPKVASNSLHFRSSSNMDVEMVENGTNIGINGEKDQKVNEKGIGIEMKQENELEADLDGDELYLSNENENIHKATLTVDGKQIKINYKDLVEALATVKKDENEKGETAMIAGENVDIKLERN